MGTFFSFSGFEFGWLLVLIMAPAAMYPTAYAVLRCWGKLRVNADGWHASGIDLGTRVLLPALRLFGWFQPLMRVESAVSRWMSMLMGAQPSEQAVSDVVVELIPIS